ncbi:MAG: GspE/PulE family protein [Simkaniaceae bacterium]|nr:GspE/PulE family protein [Simkaniaceae bacterium]
MGEEESESSYLSCAQRLGLPIVDDLSDYPFVRDRVRKLPYGVVKKHMILPLEEKGGVLVVAIGHPGKNTGQEEVRCLTGMEQEEVFCPERRISEAIESCYRQGDREASLYIEGLKKGGATTSVESESVIEEDGDLLHVEDGSPVVRLLNMVIAEAVRQKVSDIHFEPTIAGLRIRYRIDGVLQTRHTPPADMHKQLITRMKVMAKLDIAEQRLPQDGRIRLNMGKREIDFRISTLPVVFGERIVLRILDKSNILFGLQDIGMEEEMLSLFRKQVGANRGLILVTGPTGSGKTTTLYGAVSEVDITSLNLMTIEDPVEYKLPGIAQIGVNGKIGLSFARGLRHILRQDPDVIMVGEIRDKETAEIAVRSSLTGHLVLSTLHTNDAPSALIRLADMGVEPYLISSSVSAVLAQRLVRRICPHCKVEYAPSAQESADLGMDATPSPPLFRGEGCGACFGLGYRGRCGIYELMTVRRRVQNALLDSADAGAMQRAARLDGMRTLRESATMLAVQGITTASEVFRVT